MGIVSYAQNFEDVMLWRALGDLPTGFWIDVGAGDPDSMSVTRAFSEHGWRGINIEPTPVAAARLRAARPHDLNLELAVSDVAGRVPFYECADSTLSSLDPAIAAQNRADGREVVERELEVTTLAALCRVHANADIHFLKIDVEGAEAQVLAGADFTLFRPWILVIEATLPLTQTLAHQHWESGLLAADYRFAWFDGLNRFYLAGERWEALSRHFAVPPNAFDEFTLYDPAKAEALQALAGLRATAAQTEQARATAEADARQARLDAEAEMQVLRNALAEARSELAMLLAGQIRTDPSKGPVRRLAHRLRDFLLSEHRSETAGLREEMRRLASELDALRHALQLRP